MARQFDPKKVLRQISNSLLREFFTRRKQLLDLPWDQLSETNIDPIFEAWHTLPGKDRREIEAILQDINEMGDERGVKVIVEEINSRCPNKAAAFEKCEGEYDKAMWTFLHHPEIFAEAAIFARADALSTGRYWITRKDVPRKPLKVTDATRRALEEALSSHYQSTEKRGYWCRIDHYSRGNKADYFFAYLDDYAGTSITFDDEGSFVRLAERRAFENVFVYSSEDGVLDLFAKGGRKVYIPLQEVFCQAVLKEQIGPEDSRSHPYDLEILKSKDFRFPTDPADRITEVRVRRLRLDLISTPRRRITLEADPGAHRDDVHHMIERYLNGHSLPSSAVRVTQATLQLKFASNGNGRAKTLSFDVSFPNSCNLKSKPEEMRVIGERCLKKWGIKRA